MVKMENNPCAEPYYDRLIALGYQSFNYSEKHYLFCKDDRIIKIARNIYNNADTDESYYIEKTAHDILSAHGFTVAKVNRIYDKGELIENFVALEEEKINGQVYYRKDSDENVLRQILRFMQDVTQINETRFGMLDKFGNAPYSTWKDYLSVVISRADTVDKKYLFQELEYVPNDIIPSLLLTDCNTANFIFESDKLKCAIDVERPLFGDKDFIYGTIKARNPYMFELAVKDGYIKNIRLIDFYCRLYKYIFLANI